MTEQQFNFFSEALTQQNALMERLAQAVDRANQLLYALLSGEQQRRVEAASAAVLAKNAEIPRHV